MTPPRQAGEAVILGIDTSGPQCAVAVVSGARVVRRVEAMERGHAEALMPMIEAALAEAGAAIGDISRIGVCTGPGSFTGIRVGVAAARGLALGLGVPAIGIGRLEALAAQAGAGEPSIAVVRGPQGAAYAQDFDAVGEPEGPPRLIAADAPAGPATDKFTGSSAGMAGALPAGLRSRSPAGSPPEELRAEVYDPLAERSSAVRPDLALFAGSASDSAPDSAGARLLGRVLVGAGGLLPQALPDPAIIAGLAAGRAAGLPPAPLYLRDSGAAPPREAPPPLLDP